MTPTEYSEKELSHVRGKRVMVATPCYGGVLSVYYFKSFLDLVKEFNNRGVDYILQMIANESLITRARNTIVSNFYRFKDDKGTLDYLLFIDSDIQFDADAVTRLIAHDKDVVVAPYPLKMINFNQVEYQSLSARDLAMNTTEYVINLKFGSDEERQKGQIHLREGLMEVVDGGTGFMLIKRSVIEKMIKHYPELAYKNDAHEVKLDGTTSFDTVNTNYALFDTMIDTEDKRYLSEDYAFCRRWQEIGGRVWLDPFITLNHVGNHIFQGKPLIKEEKAQTPEE